MTEWFQAGTAAAATAPMLERRHACAEEAARHRDIISRQTTVTAVHDLVLPRQIRMSASFGVVVFVGFFLKPGVAAECSTAATFRQQH
jgi:hypothetical protein